MAEPSRPAGRLLGLAKTLESHSGFADVVANLHAGHGGTIGGTWGSSSALTAAALALALDVPVRKKRGDTAAAAQGVLVVVLPHAADADSFLDDVALFTDRPVALLPAIESLDNESAADDPAAAARLALVKQLTMQAGGTATPPAIIVTSIQALLSPLADPREIEASTRRLQVGGRLDPAELADWLAARGWQAADAIDRPGTFARRGGIVDLFAVDWDRPVRVELFGDEIESLRTFDTVSQRSVNELTGIDLTALALGGGGDRTGGPAARLTQLADIVPPGSWWALVEPGELAQEAKRTYERLKGAAEVSDPEDVFARIYRFPSVTLASIAQSSLEATAALAVESVERFTGVLDRVCEELATVGRDQEVWIVAPTEAEEKRLAELLGGSAPAKSKRLHFARGHLSGGFRLVPEKLVILSSAELFRREDVTVRAPRHRLTRAIDTFLDLHEGDYVVHVAHGIGRYRGLKLLEKQDRTEEFLEIEFAESTRVYVPASCIELVQKYVGGSKLAPKLAKVGGTLWAKQKLAVQQAVADMAADMIQLQARRAERPGIAFPPDTPWQRTFEESFPFDETPDQLTAVEAIRGDMQGPKPMDRLLCGDVGFGKTEMAMRAAFKAVEAGYQVAVLVPTTVLAEQHRRSFTARFSEFPFTIRGLSRFSSPQEERDTLEGLARGTVDLVIGTHRLAQADIHFANLGLLVVDEEQRFGVDVKERLKALRASVDVLTMTATPIPRTLHMSMLGIRDISNLTTPPANRIAVETRVARWDKALIKSAIDRELARNGQVFFVHNRIHDIHMVAQRLAQIVPEATISIGHGRLSESELEEVMLDFVAGRTDILLATTIIESGLDIPNANTIFVDEADTYGLADLHQLRGRVGRSHHRAYCYMLVDETAHLTSTAARRLRAIQEFSSMGAGFSLAMRDLEIRGAGNLLGTQQSGHIATVGYELYCRLLEQAVRGLKALPPAEPPQVNLDLPGEAWLPRDFIADFRTKIDVYRRLSRATAENEIDDLAAELVDRFGPLPAEVERLLEFARLRVAAAALSIDSLARHPGMVVIGHHDRPAMLALKGSGRPGAKLLRIVDEKTVVLPVDQGTLANPEKLLAALRTLLRRQTGRAYSPGPSKANAHEPSGPAPS
ncbi:MAG: transcription-repair coupling factor [Planctomycetia bacterium]|nr:transcription-repair coupling factor [Planctomycetia bacterium]